MARCIACHRTNTRTEDRPGVPGPVCVDPTDCRRHWPTEDQLAIRRNP